MCAPFIKDGNLFVFRLKSRESQKYIDLGLAENNEFAAWVCATILRTEADGK